MDVLFRPFTDDKNENEDSIVLLPGSSPFMPRKCFELFWMEVWLSLASPTSSTKCHLLSQLVNHSTEIFIFKVFLLRLCTGLVELTNCPRHFSLRFVGSSIHHEITNLWKCLLNPFDKRENSDKNHTHFSECKHIVLMLGCSNWNQLFLFVGFLKQFSWTGLYFGGNFLMNTCTWNLSVVTFWC